MTQTYQDYVRDWLDTNPELGESPKSYQEWELENYFELYPTPKEWEETEKLYSELCNIASRIEDIRVILYNNRVHRQLCEDWKTKDDILFRIQSELRNSDDEDNYFGAYKLMGYC